MANAKVTEMEPKMTKEMTEAETVAFEDEILKQRLIADGDGRGELQIIQKFTQDYVTWVMSNNSKEGDSDEVRKQKAKQNEIGLRKLKVGLETLKFLIRRTSESINTVQSTKEEYISLQKTIKKEIGGAGIHRQKFLELRATSEGHKRIQKQKMECDAVADALSGLPSRKQIEKELEASRKELEERKVKEAKLSSKKLGFQEQFALFLNCSRDLAEMVAEDEQDRKFRMSIDDTSNAGLDELYANMDEEMGKEQSNDDDSVRKPFPVLQIPEPVGFLPMEVDIPELLLPVQPKPALIRPPLTKNPFLVPIIQYQQRQNFPSSSAKQKDMSQM